MIKVGFSASFKKALKKITKNNISLEKIFWKSLEIFINNPFDERLRTHKLSGKLRNLWSFSVEYDIRIIFYFSDMDNAIFTDIGKHDEVY